MIAVAILFAALPMNAGAEGFREVTEEWVAIYNSPGHDVDMARAIATDSLGNVYVTGYSKGSGTSYDYTTIAYDTSGNQLWIAIYNGPVNGYDQAVDLEVDSFGNIYVTGFSYGDGTNYDFATIAYDSSGNQLWVARYNGPGNGYDNAVDMAIGSSGNVYVTGRSEGIGTGIDFVTIAYDSLGNQLWVTRYNAPANDNDYPYGMAIDSLENVYVTGYCYLSATNYDYTTIAYDSAGSQLWVAEYDSPSNGQDIAEDIATDSFSNVYVTGRSLASGTSWDYATVAYDTSGNQLWVARYNGPVNSYDCAHNIAVDPSGNVYVSGESDGDGTYRDYTTVVYNSLGNQLWAARYNGPGNGLDRANAISLDSLGNVYVTGYSYDNESYDDYATVAYDHFGNQLWVIRYNGPGNTTDITNAMAVDSSGNVYVTGHSAVSRFDLNYATIKYSQQLAPKKLMQDAITDLEAAKSEEIKDADKINKKLDKAIEHLQKSLNIDPKNLGEPWKDKDLWLDENTLDPKEGKYVLREWGKAAKELSKLIKENNKGKLDVPESIIQKCRDTIDMLVEMAEQFATDAYQEAQKYASIDKVDKELAKCLNGFEKAQDDLDHLDKDDSPDPKYDRAINHYKMVWEHAQKAIKHGEDAT